MFFRLTFSLPALGTSLCRHECSLTNRLKVARKGFDNAGNYEYFSTSFVGQYVRVVCDVIVVTIARLKVHKKNLQISIFADYLKKLVR